jgi:hypothetical protein
LSEVSPTPRNFTLITDWNPGASQGDATGAQVKVAGHTVMPPTQTPSSASGCSPADFTGFTGKIALIQRGTCNFGVKVLNATHAGAVGVIIFNEGNPGRQAVFSGSMSDADGNPFVASIPVAFTSFDIGKSLYDQSAGATPPVMNLSIHQIVDPNRTDWNVIAESKGGDPNHVVVVDAHLDAIYGAGMLDNASGSATILDIAQKMRKANPLNKLRFIWFGGEELGELGSKYYVNNLSPSELAKIRYDLDADVMATPNYSIGILDPAAVDLFGAYRQQDVPAERLRAVEGRARHGRELLQLHREEPHLLLAGRNRRGAVPVGGHSGQRPADRAGLLQDAGGGRPLRRVHRQLRGQRAELRRRLRRQPVPLVRQPLQQRSQRLHVHVEGVRRHDGAHGVQHKRRLGGRDAAA